MSVFPVDSGRMPIGGSDPETDLRSVHATVATLVQHEVGLPNLALTPETAYVDIPDWDSISHANVVYGVEQRFGIRLNDEELYQLRSFVTLGEFESLVRTKLMSGA